VNVISHTDGDAKWYAEPVEVEEGKSYTYTDYYKSSVTTRVVAAFMDDEENYSYMELDGAPSAVNWTQYSATFTTPTNTEKVTLYHLVDSVGTLTIDDTSLMYNGQPPVDGENIVANPSMETADGSAPEDWASSGWGTNGRSFTYENTGRTGSRSVSTTISTYTDGDAKWYFESVDVVPSKLYHYMDYYKASTATRVVVAFIDSSNNYTYQELDGATAANDWTQYTDDFTTPSAAVKAVVYHLIDGVGTVTIDDVSLIKEPDDLPVVTVSGTLTTNETWTADSVYYVNAGLTIPDDVTLTIEAGTIVKLATNNGITVQPGGALLAEGTAQARVVFTSYKDDTEGGDSNTDGASSGGVNDYTSVINNAGGSVVSEYSLFKHAQYAIIGSCPGNAGAISVSDGIFNSPVSFSSCQSPTNVFLRNKFDITTSSMERAVEFSEADPSGLALSGFNKNSFTSVNNVAYVASYTLNNTMLATGSTWSVSGSASAVIHANSMGVAGTLNLSNGAIVKPIDNGTAFKVRASGVVNVEGTSDKPVIFTSSRDDTTGGDTNRDGGSTMAGRDYSMAIESVGLLNIDHAAFKHSYWSISMICSSNDAATTSVDSVYEATFAAYECGQGDLSMLRNAFNLPAGNDWPALNLVRTVPSGVILSGTNKNTFAGDARSKTIEVFKNGQNIMTLPEGDSWTISSSGGGIIRTNWFKVAGNLTIDPGSIIKIERNGEGFTFVDEATVDINGTSSSPVSITSARDDSLGGDSDANGSTTVPDSDYAFAIAVAGDAELAATYLNVLYGGTSAQASGNGAMDIRQAELAYGLTGIQLSTANDNFFKNVELHDLDIGMDATAGGNAILRGSIHDLNSSGWGIKACDWDSTSCSIDASYVDWDRTDGPFMSSGNNLVCGNVVVSPWTTGSSTDSTAFGAVKNCDGSSMVDDVDSAATSFHSAVAAKGIDCSGGMQAACDAINTAFACYSAAINIAASQSPIPITFNNPVQNNDDSRNVAMDGISSTMDAYSVVNPSSYTNATKIRVGNATGLFGALYSAYNSCRP